MILKYTVWGGRSPVLMEGQAVDKLFGGVAGRDGRPFRDSVDVDSDTVDASLADVFNLALDADKSLAVENMRDGQRITIRVTQVGGGHTLALSTPAVVFPADANLSKIPTGDGLTAWVGIGLTAGAYEGTVLPFV